MSPSVPVIATPSFASNDERLLSGVLGGRLLLWLRRQSNSADDVPLFEAFQLRITQAKHLAQHFMIVAAERGRERAHQRRFLRIAHAIAVQRQQMRPDK